MNAEPAPAVSVRAPGKVVLLGEYAVLDGAPALVAAVDQGVGCAWSPGPERRIIAPDTRFVGPALDAADAPPGTYTFTAWNPPPTGTKAGLGSSAAATVAAVLAARRAAGVPCPAPELQALAAAVHRAVQGSGSGIDVAASVWGGILRFQDGKASPQPVGDLADRLSVVWSGASAATGPRVERYRAAADRAAFVAASAALVDGWASDPIGAFAENGRLLAELDRAAGIGWWVDAYAPLLARAAAHGGAAKPSGAGGGDVVVALFPDAARRAAFEADCRTIDRMVVLPVRLAGPADDGASP